jgi:hypothetical protein
MGSWIEIVKRKICDWIGVQFWPSLSDLLCDLFETTSSRNAELRVSTVSLCLAGMLVLAGVPLVLGLVRPNRLVGVRTPKTLADSQAWYRANRVAGLWYVLTGLAIAGVIICRDLVQAAAPPTSLVKRAPDYVAWLWLPRAGVLTLGLLALGAVARLIHGALAGGARSTSELDPSQRYRSRAATRARLVLYTHIIALLFCVLAMYERVGVRLFEQHTIGMLALFLARYGFVFPLFLACVAVPSAVWRWCAFLGIDLILWDLQGFASFELTIRY